MGVCYLQLATCRRVARRHRQELEDQRVNKGRRRRGQGEERAQRPIDTCPQRPTALLHGPGIVSLRLSIDPHCSVYCYALTRRRGHRLCWEVAGEEPAVITSTCPTTRRLSLLGVRSAHRRTRANGSDDCPRRPRSLTLPIHCSVNTCSFFFRAASEYQS